jgi:hypothetical protein
MAAGKKYLRCGCPSCGNVITYPDYSAGGTSVCDRCRENVRLPAVAVTPPPARSGPPPAPPTPKAADRPPTRADRKGFLRFILWSMNLAVLGAVAVALLKRPKTESNEPALSESPTTALPVRSVPSSTTTTTNSPPATPGPTPTPTPVPVTNVVTITNVVTLTNAPAPPAATTRPPTPAATNSTAAPVTNATNNLAVLGLSIERPRGGKGSRLTYVTGVLQNRSDRKRFGVRIDLNLLDRTRQLVGMATDYTPVIEPKDTWRFRALVLDSRAVGASVATIKEDQ